MPRSLSFRAKIVLLPALATLGSVAIFLTTMSLGSRAESKLSLIQTAHAPAVQESERLQETVVAIQRTLQDGVAAANAGALDVADSLAREFGRVTTRLESNPTVEAAHVRAIRGAFDAYMTAARQVASALLARAWDDSAGATAKEMSSRLVELRARLGAQTKHAQEGLTAAFEQERELQRTMRLVTVAVLLVVVLGLALLSTRVIRDVLSVLSSMSSAAAAIAQGRIEQRIEHRGNDEIGQLADAFRAMIAYVRGIALAADGLARGDFSHPVEPRSEDDVLSQNMRRATETLQTLLRDTHATIEAAREGKLSRRGDASRFEGAYASLVHETNAMVDALVAPLTEAATVMQRLAQRDLTARIEGSYQGDVADTKRLFNSAVDSLDGALSDVAAFAASVSSASDQISESSQSLASGAAAQAAALDEVSSNIHQLSAMARENASRAQEGQKSAEANSADAERGQHRVEHLVTVMQRVKGSADATARIVRTIDEIAFQTNLLALNAAVEAARAGDAGRGFAVVADEVRNLALRSAEAARQTAALIDEAMRNAEGGVAESTETQATFIDIGRMVQHTREVLRDIAAASSRQHAGVEHADGVIEQIHHVTQSVAATAEESASASAELRRQAQRLRELTDSFRLSRGAAPAVASPAVPAAPPAPRPGTRPPLRRANKAPVGARTVLKLAASQPAAEPAPADDDLLAKF